MPQDDRHDQSFPGQIRSHLSTSSHWSFPDPEASFGMESSTQDADSLSYQSSGMSQRPQASGGDSPLAARTRPLMDYTASTEARRFPKLASAQMPESRSSTASLNSLGKRIRSSNADESSLPHDQADGRIFKRATPDPASLIAPVMSRESSGSSLGFQIDDVDAEDWKLMLGYDPRENVKRFKDEQRQQLASASQGRETEDERARLEQERQDAEFARQLQEDLNRLDQGETNLDPRNISMNALESSHNHDTYQPVDLSQPEIRGPPSLLTQASPSRDPEILHSWEQRRHSNEGSGIHSSNKSNNILRTESTEMPGSHREDSDDELEVIDGSNFRPNNRRLPGGGFGTNSGANNLSSGGYDRSIPIDLSGNQRSTSSHYNHDPYSTTMDGLQRQLPFSSSHVPPYGNSHRSGVSNLGFTSARAAANEFKSDIVSMGFAIRPIMPDESRRDLPWLHLNSRRETPPMDLFERHLALGVDEDNSEALKDLLNNIRPDEEDDLGAGSSEKHDTPEGMADTASLYKYQQKGLAWLTSMEEGTNKGCILADDMGLGKTIQAIALMVSRRSENPLCKTNLIIAPVALIRQWENEIRTKVRRTHALSVAVYHGSSKSSLTWDALRHYDVVISTYGMLTADHKKKMEYEKRKKDNPNYSAQPSDLPVLTGDNCKFYRCILDEAQNVKNRFAKSALAAQTINAKYRLCMTGTPMMNNVVELYSLIRFLKIQPYCQWEKFQIDFARPLSKNSHYGRERALNRLQALCKAIMLRRTKKSEMDGKPLVVLPERVMNVDHAVFDRDEQEFYNALEAKTQLTFNKFLKAGTIGRNYSNMLTLLLRLRQACCHPHLIRDFAVVVDASPEKLSENAESLADEVVRRLIENGIPECPVCMDTAENYTLFLPCGHNTCPECFCQLTDPSTNPNAIQSEHSNKAKFSCPSCRVEINPILVTDLIHFKKLHQPGETGNDDHSGSNSDSADSDTSSSDDDEDDDDDKSDDGSLADFVVKDEDVESAHTEMQYNDDEDDLDNMQPAKLNSRIPSDEQLKRSSRNVKTESDVTDGSDDLDANPSATALVQSARKIKQEGLAKNKAQSLYARTSGRRVLRAHGRHTDGNDDGDNTEDDDDDGISVPGYRNGKNPFEKSGQRNKKDSGIVREQRYKGKKKEKSRRKAKRKGPTKTLAQLKKEGMRNAASRKEYFRRLAKEFIPSAKITKCMDVLNEIMASPKHEKVIVFSQFTSLLDLVEVPVHRAGWRFRRFDGSMNANERNKSVVDFTNDAQVRILLVSLKAGNAGLNLTAASQVIIMDPFWNPYIEEQAIDRAHRIGQRRPVQIHRILVSATVEDRILALQEKKRELIEGALDESAGRDIGRLGVRELGYLFGISANPS